MTQTLTRTRPQVSRQELADAAGARAAAQTHREARRDLTGLVSEVPVSIARSHLDFPAKMLSNSVNYNGQAMSRLRGIASVTGIEYEMWDMFGPYMESIRPTAFDVTLATGPDVTFLMNHEGITMARTVLHPPGKEPTLILGMVTGPNPTDNGLGVTAYVNPKRSDIAILLTAIDDHLVTEMSFRFMINQGWWSEDYMHFEIAEVDIDRGDVSAVNYGANPYTSIASRQRSVLDLMRHAPAPTVAGVLRTLAARADVVPMLRAMVATGVPAQRGEADPAEVEDQADAAERACPECETSCAADDKFCHQCGTTLDDVEATADAPDEQANAATAPAETRSSTDRPELTRERVYAEWGADLL